MVKIHNIILNLTLIFILQILGNGYSNLIPLKNIEFYNGVKNILNFNTSENPVGKTLEEMANPTIQRQDGILYSWKFYFFLTLGFALILTSSLIYLLKKYDRKLSYLKDQLKKTKEDLKWEQRESRKFQDLLEKQKLNTSNTSKDNLAETEEKPLEKTWDELPAQSNDKKPTEDVFYLSIPEGEDKFYKGDALTFSGQDSLFKFNNKTRKFEVIGNNKGIIENAFNSPERYLKRVCKVENLLDFNKHHSIQTVTPGEFKIDGDSVIVVKKAIIKYI